MRSTLVIPEIDPLFVAGSSTEIWISEIRMFASSTPPEFSFQYPNSHYTFLVDLDVIDIAPLSPGFEQFEVDPPLPAGISMNSVTGEIEGCGMIPAETTHEVTAYNRVTHEKVSTNLTLSLVTCDSDHQLVEVRQISQLNSGSERWRLVQGENIIGEGKGVDCGDHAIETVTYFCLEKGVFELQRQLSESRVSTRSGHLVVRLNLVFRSSFQTWQTIAMLPFDQCRAEWSDERPAFSLDGCWSFLISTTLLASSESKWMVNTDGKMDPEWFEMDFVEDWRWKEETMNTLGRSVVYRLRRWIAVNRTEVEAVDVMLGYIQNVWIVLNGKYVVERKTNGVNPMIVRLSADRFNEDLNLIAIMFSCFDCDSYEIPSVLLHVVLNREPLWMNDDMVTIRSYSFVPDFPPLLAIDGNPYTLWKGNIENGISILSIEFDHSLAMGVNAYCITAPSQSLEAVPTGWRIHGRGTDRRWIVLQVQQSITFSRRGEKRCFPIVDLVPRFIVLTEIEFMFVGSPSQREIHIAELSLMTVALERTPLPSFDYPNNHIDYVVGVDFPTIETPCPLYTSYSTASLLPPGVRLDSGDGRFVGTPSEDATFSQVEIQAIAPTQQGVTILQLTPVICQSPFARVSIIIDHTENVDSFLSFSLWKDSHLLQESFVLPTGGSFMKMFCVQNGLYRLQFNDASNAGFLETTYQLLVDDVSLHHGYFNPGFSSPSIRFVAGLLLPPHTLWYFSVDGSEPPLRWFETIDSVHETWSVAYPGEFPEPIGRAQYYKTVMDLGSQDFDLQDQVALEVQFLVCGGAMLYLNGHEVLRHRLPSGDLTVDSTPLRSFNKSEVISVVLPLQFLDISSEVQVIAVELHDDIPREADFQLWVSIHSNGSKQYLEGEVTTDLPIGASQNLDRVTDGQYYQYATLDNDSASIMIDLKEKKYEYITDLCYYSSNHDGTYPHSIAIDGGEIQEDGVIKWSQLFATDQMVIDKVAFGQSACFTFYSDRSYSLFRLQLQNPDYKQRLEVAEVEFFAQRLDGFCEGGDAVQFSRTPSGQWKDFGCDELYEGELLRYCEEGEWTETSDHCLPRSPSAFHYSASVFYVSRRNSVSFSPTVVGAELFFFADPIPQGMTFDNTTGTFSGVYKGSANHLNIYVSVSNVGGMKDTWIELYAVNGHEEWLFVIAFLGVACLVAFIVYLSISMRRSEEAVKLEAKMSHLDIDGVPKKMLPLLV